MGDVGKILEEKLKSRLLDPRVYCTLAGSQTDCFKTGYWCGAADALEETRSRCSEEVIEDPDKGVTLERNSDGVYVPAETNSSAFELDKAQRKIAELHKEIESLQKKNIQLQRDFAECNKQRNEYRDANVSLNSTVDVLEKRRGDLLAENIHLSEQYSELEKRYNRLADDVYDLSKALDKIDISSIYRLINLARNAVASEVESDKMEDLDL